MTIDVTNQAPVVGDASLTTIHDHSVSSSVYAYDTDSDPVTVSVISSTSNGTLSMSGGSFTYTPNQGYVGQDSFTFKANDGITDSKTATVTINVTNQAPVAGSQSFSTNHDQQLNSSIEASDGDGDSLTFSKVGDTSHGKLTLNADGSFTYIPTPHYVGQDSFSFKVNDGITDSNTATVTLNVLPVPVTVESSAGVTWNYVGDGSLSQWLAGNNSVSVNLSGLSNDGATFTGPPTVNVNITDRFANTHSTSQPGTPVYFQSNNNGNMVAGYTVTVDVTWSYSRVFLFNMIPSDWSDAINGLLGDNATITMESKITLTIYADGTVANPVITNTDNSSAWSPSNSN